MTYRRYTSKGLLIIGIVMVIGLVLVAVGVLK